MPGLEGSQGEDLDERGARAVNQILVLERRTQASFEINRSPNSLGRSRIAGSSACIGFPSARMSSLGNTATDRQRFASRMPAWRQVSSQGCQDARSHGLYFDMSAQKKREPL